MIKKIIVSFLLGAYASLCFAQNYQITFTGIGASTTVDSVLVENLSQGMDILVICQNVRFKLRKIEAF